MDWQGLLHNRWVWIGGAAAGGLGLVVYLRRKNQAGSASATVGAQATPAYAGGVGGFDSTGTDVAAWLGNYSGNLQNQLDQYQQQLTGALQGLQQVPTAPAGTGAPSAGSSTGTQGPITPNAARFINPNGTLSIGANQPLGLAAGSVGLTEGQLLALNPGLSGNIKDVGGVKYTIRGMPYKIS